MTLLRQLVFLASWRLCVRHFFTQRREVAKEERSVMRVLLELSGLQRNCTRKLALHSPCSLSDFAPLRETFSFHAKTQRKKDRSPRISSSSVASTKTLPKTRSSIALVLLIPLRLCVTHFHFTQRREVAKEERSVMRVLLELGSLHGAFADD